MPGQIGSPRVGSIRYMSCPAGGVRTSAAGGRRLSGVPGRVQDGGGMVRCSWTRLDLVGHDPKPASRWPGTLRDYGRHTDRTRYSRGGKWRKSRSVTIPMGWDRLTVKPLTLPEPSLPMTLDTDSNWMLPAAAYLRRAHRDGAGSVLAAKGVASPSGGADLGRRAEDGTGVRREYVGGPAEACLRRPVPWR